MNWFDLIMLSIIFISVLISLVRGFVKESISLGSWVVAGWVAIHYAAALADALSPYIESPTIRTAAAYSALLLAVLVLGILVNFLVSKMVSKTNMSGTDRLLGMIFGGVRGLLIVTLLVYFAGLSSISTEFWWQESVMVDYFVRLADWFAEVILQNATDQLTG